MYYVASDEWIHTFFDNGGKNMSFMIEGDNAVCKM